MADVHNIATRSYNMSRIRGKDTKPELLVRKFLHANGFRYLLHNKKLPGKPDLTLPKYQTVIFVHGCFWHSHENCKYAVIPQTNIKFWTDKLSLTKERDKLHKSKLITSEWRVIEIYECQLKPDQIHETYNDLIKILKNNNHD